MSKVTGSKTIQIQVRLVILYYYTHFTSDRRADCITECQLASEVGGYGFETFQVLVLAIEVAWNAKLSSSANEWESIMENDDLWRVME